MEEQEPVGIVHHLYALALEVRCLQAPIDPSKTIRILDVGCESGTWYLEVINRYEHAEVDVISFDAPSMAVESGARRVRYHHCQDIAHDWPNLDPAFYDIVHARGLSSILRPSQCTSLYRKALHHLKPGGYLELAEIDLRPQVYGLRLEHSNTLSFSETHLVRVSSASQECLRHATHRPSKSLHRAHCGRL